MKGTRKAWIVMIQNRDKKRGTAGLGAGSALRHAIVDTETLARLIVAVDRFRSSKNKLA